jgi:ABC-type transporter Mla subunit MlaD
MLGTKPLRRSREERMINGIMVLVLAIVVLAIVWAIVIYGSTYFGPRTH